MLQFQALATIPFGSFGGTGHERLEPRFSTCIFGLERIKRMQADALLRRPSAVLRTPSAAVVEHP